MNARFDDIQRRFMDALHDPRQERVLNEAVSVVPDLVTKRLDVYRNNVRVHLYAALKNAYPVLLALTGEAYFSDLARDYALAHPSNSGDLNTFGAELACFIEAWEKDARYAYFGDMARLEWAIHEAHAAADVIALSAAQWQEIDSETLLTSSLAVHPACTSLRSRFAIFDIWRAHQLNGALPASVDNPACGLIVRRGWRPTVVDQSIAAHEALLALQRGQILNDAIDIALGQDDAFDISMQLREWIECGAIIGLRE